MPWPGDRAAAAARAGRAANSPPRPRSIWLSDGLEDGQSNTLRDAFQRYGGVTALRARAHRAGPVAGDARRHRLCPDRHPRHGRPRRWRSRPAPSARAAKPWPRRRIRFRRGETKRARPYRPADGSAQRHRAAGDRAAKTAPARCNCWTGARPSAAPASCRRMPRREGQPLLSDIYYLERALSPYAEIAKGNISQLAGQACLGAAAGRCRPKSPATTLAQGQGFRQPRAAC